MSSEKYIENAKKYIESKAIDAFEIVYHEKERLLSEAKDGAIESLTEAKEAGLAIRVLKNHKMGFSFTTSLDEQKIKDSIDAAILSAEEVDGDAARSFVPSKSLPKIEWKYFDETLENIPVAEKINKAVQLEASAKSFDSRIKKVRNASYEEVKSLIHIVNSEGLSVCDRQSIAGCQLIAVAEENGESQWAWDFDFAHLYKNLDVESAGKRAAGEALSFLGASQIPTQKISACIHPYVSAQLLKIMSKGFCGDNIYKKKSTLIGKMGENIFSKLLNIIDDGLLEGGYESFPFDGEGSPRRKTYLVKNGRVENWLTDSYWGKKLGVSSTASSTRGSIRDIPSIGISNLYIEPSKKTPEDLFKEMVNGFFITDVIGIHTANPITGDFSVGAGGIWIENGKPKHPVKGVAIAGNLHDIFRDVVAVGNDLRFMGDVGSPTIMISEVQISGA